MTTASSADVESVIVEFLTERGGSATAGHVTAHAVGLGFAASTVRRAADTIVSKTRTGNTHTWALPGVQHDAADETEAPADRDALEARARALGIEFDDNTTDDELAALIEDEFASAAVEPLRAAVALPVLPTVATPPALPGPRRRPAWAN